MSEENRPYRWYKLAFKVLWDAYCHFSDDDGWAMASHVALSGLLALFPFLIFGTALAGFLGAGGFSETAIHLLFDTWPADIAAPIASEIQRVLTMPRGGLLTVSVLAAAYFASNGVEALRISLNRAYRVTETRPWYVTRLASLGYVVIAVVIFAVISILLLAVPVAMRFAETRFPWLISDLARAANWGLYGTGLLLMIGLLLSHKWLPAGHRRIIDILPGVLMTIALWIGFGLGFAAYLSTFANYAATYAGLASIMIVLIFLYMVGVIFMLGAELNAALMKYRVYSVFSRLRNERRRREEALSKTDEAADVVGSEPLVAERREPR
ncbi:MULTISPECIES: YihY/virulence factor BrkB family protein [Rhizobium/Agrobacterium group]|uniref:YihY/virulence factor BrkB family protein n=2 Tax=Neorhizobium TaxID=1525371 RepID=A0ABV0LZ33_9HYPH|nr:MULTISPECIES: YihY/virulence factor BrkB family protein [Rhizobium/Agrobacterium group]MBP1845264.1 membrane protein [Neorhizobium petrolearium]MCC2612220.1 YihY/virulence factor BrkB family protein [Neorhizobium petrolearium]WGI67370.1 YihY/virulence factor BrkB family protein [Neorhizobium petrolearium]